MPASQPNQTGSIHAPELPPNAAIRARAPSAIAQVAVTVGTLAAAVLVIAVGWVVMWSASRRLSPDPAGDARRASEQLRVALIAQAERRGPALPMLDPAVAKQGRDTFFTTCITCHGADGTGVPGLGRTLVESEFVRRQSDAALVEMIASGRAPDHPLNITKIAMPPRGGNAGLTDSDLWAVVQYLRAMQDPRRMPELPPFVPPPIAPPTAAEKDAALAAAGGDAELAEYIVSGTKLYGMTCVACHGPGGQGMPGNGKPLAGSDFINSLDDEGLLAFVKKGRDPGDPANTTGVAMPPKGGNPALSDDDLLDIISYLRTLPGNKPVAPQAGNTK